MNDHTMNRKALRGSATLHMPLQAVPINRTVSPAALAGTPGVEADGWRDWAKKIGGFGLSLL